MSNRIVHKAFPPGGWKLKRDSLSKMVIYMAPRSGRIVRYSYDWKTDKTRDQPLRQELGLDRLEKMLFTKFQGFHHAIVYDMESDTQIREYNAKRHRII